MALQEASLHHSNHQKFLGVVELKVVAQLKVVEEVEEVEERWLVVEEEPVVRLLLLLLDMEAMLGQVTQTHQPAWGLVLAPVIPDLV